MAKKVKKRQQKKNDKAELSRPVQDVRIASEGSVPDQSGGSGDGGGGDIKPPSSGDTGG